MNALWMFRSHLTFLLRPHHLLHVGRSLLLSASMLLTLVAYPHAASAETLSEGCQNLNHPIFDAFYQSAAAIPLPFFAGEQVVATAGPPDQFSPHEVTLRVNGELVASSPYPATLTYTIPADGRYSINLEAVAGNATWDVSCAEGGPRVPTHAEECKNGGYRDFIDPRTGEPFKNQGACVAYVNRQR